MSGEDWDEDEYGPRTIHCWKCGKPYTGTDAYIPCPACDQALGVIPESLEASDYLQPARMPQSTSLADDYEFVKRMAAERGDSESYIRLCLTAFEAGVTPEEFNERFVEGLKEISDDPVLMAWIKGGQTP